MKVRFLALLIGAVTVVHQGYSQEKVSLEDAISIALQKNFDVQLIRVSADSAKTNYNYSFGAFLPQLNASGSYNQSVSDARSATFGNDTTAVVNKTTHGAGTHVLSGSLQMNWTLFDGTRMFATRQRIRQLAELGVVRVQNQMMNSVAAVMNNYFNIIRQKQQLVAINDVMAVVDERVKLADKKLQVGTGGKPELLQAKVDLNTQRVLAVQQETLIQQLKDQMNGLLGMQLPPVYDTSDTIPIDLTLTQQGILEDIENTNQALLIAKKNIDVAQTQLWETRALRSPVLSFNAAYNYNKTNNYLAQTPFSLRLNQSNGLNYGLNLSLPILNNLSTDRLLAIANIRLGRTRLAYEQQKAVAIVAIRVAYIGYDNAKKILLIEEDNIKLAKENVFIALETFKRGINTFLELRTAQQTLSDVYNQLITARYNAKIAEIELMRLKGALLAGQ